MRLLITAILCLLSSAAFAQTLAPVPPRCWTRGASAGADAAGMPLTVCLSYLKPAGNIAFFSGTAMLAGGAQTEALTGSRALNVAKDKTSAWTTIFVWEAGLGEFDEESVVQIWLKLDSAGAVVTGSEKLIAFHQCPERGCSYACGVTGVEFKAN